MARNVDKLNAVAKEIQNMYNVNTIEVVFDFGSDISIESYEKFAKKFKDLDISIIVNNVGVGNVGYFVEHTP